MLEMREASFIRGCESGFMTYCAKSLNPTHGSGWIVQVQPTRSETACLPFLFFSSQREEKKDNNVIWTGSCCRSDLNHPPTAVGGIWSLRTVSWDFGLFAQSRGIRSLSLSEI